MTFTPGPIEGCWIIDPKLIHDDRGFFTTLWSRKDFQSRGMLVDFDRYCTALNHKSGTLRGMHFQVSPHEEAKFVRCTQGAFYDVVIDLRPASPTYKRWMGVELTAANRTLFYIPPGLAHGYVTLVDNTEITYSMSADYSPDHARGVRWNDPAFNVVWPGETRIIHPRDANYPDYRA